MSATTPAMVFKDILQTHILPLLHGGMVLGPYVSARRPTSMVSFNKQHRMKVYFSEQSKEYFVLQREQPFYPAEKELVERVLSKFRDYNVLNSRFYQLVARASVEHCIAEYISKEHADTIYKIIQIYNQWSTQTYEGNRITHSIGIYLDRESESGSNLVEFKNEDFIKTLGANSHTLLTVDAKGFILGLETVVLPRGDIETVNETFAPICMIGQALWGDTPEKAIVHLTANGEILLFKDSIVVFAKRRAHWCSFPHSLLMNEVIMNNLSPTERKVQKAVYLTALDVAFEYNGACIGIFQDKDKKTEGLHRVRAEYLFSSKKANSATKLLTTLVDGKKFYEIPRRIRVELCAIDGAVLLDSEGEVLTVGAILKTKGNAANGGGRTAAAQALAKSGTGIKISHDGYIEIYKGSKPSLAFL